MKIIVLVLTFMCAAYVTSRAQGMRFETGSWSEVLEKAKSENKLVFVDVYTKWCEPCKLVAQNVFPKKEMGDYYNPRFICYSIDAESPAGQEFVKKYPVSAYPTFFYINTSGEIAYKFSGAGGTDRFIKEAEFVSIYAQHGGYEKMMSAIKNGTTDTTLLYDYYLSMGNENKSKALNLYLKALPDKNLLLGKSELLWEVSKYDEDLINRLVDKIVSYSNDPQFTQMKEFQNTITPIRVYISKNLEKSIKEKNLKFFNELMTLKNKLANCKGDTSKGDMQLSSEKELCYATPEYVQLCYWARNRIDEQKFRNSLITYMDQFMKNNPVDSLWDEYHLHALEIEKEFVNIGQSSMYLMDIVNYMNFTTKNMIHWVDCFWRVSPSDATTKSLCKQWIDYICRANVYNTESAMLSADLLNKIGYSKEAIALLEKSITNIKKVIVDDDASLRPVNLMLQDLKNKKM